MQQKHLIVVGGGHGAVQLCSALRAKQFPGPITLISAENYLPYQRPLLSKGFLYNSAAELVPLKPASWYAQERIKVVLNTQVDAIAPDQCQVILANGTSLAYDYLVLALGSGPKLLPFLAPDLTNSYTLRTAADAVAIKTMLARATTQLTIVGGGFLGLELAATAHALGKTVRVLEAGASLMRRSLSPACAEYVRTTHGAAGIQISLGAKVGEATVHNKRLTHLLINDVPKHVTELLVAIGSVPEQALAVAAGIKCNNGIIVDQYMRTSADNIFAVGDCAAFYAADMQQYWRFESIYNAVEQAKIAAATMMGENIAYQPLPCFWSEQGSLKLQMVGCLPDKLTSTIRREGKTPDEFSLFHYLGKRLVCVESVNSPLDHGYAKQLLARNINPTSAQMQDKTLSLQALLHT